MPAEQKDLPQLPEAEYLPDPSLKDLLDTIDQRRTFYDRILGIIKSEQDADLDVFKSLLGHTAGVPTLKTPDEIAIAIIESLGTEKQEDLHPQGKRAPTGGMDLPLADNPVPSGRENAQEVVVFEQENSVLPETKPDQPKDDEFVMSHPVVQKLMDLKVGDQGSPWKESQSQVLLPVAYIIKLFEVKESHSDGYNLYQAIDYQLKRWTKARDNGELIVNIGPRQKTLKKENVLDFLKFVADKISLKGYPYNFSRELNLPTAKPRSKLTTNDNTQPKGEPEIVEGFSMKGVPVSQPILNKRKPLRSRTMRTSRRPIPPGQSSLGYIDVWLVKPRETEWDERRKKLQNSRPEIEHNPPRQKKKKKR